MSNKNGGQILCNLFCGKLLLNMLNTNSPPGGDHEARGIMGDLGGG